MLDGFGIVASCIVCVRLGGLGKNGIGDDARDSADAYDGGGDDEQREHLLVFIGRSVVDPADQFEVGFYVASERVGTFAFNLVVFHESWWVRTRLSRAMQAMTPAMIARMIDFMALLLVSGLFQRFTGSGYRHCEPGVHNARDGSIHVPCLDQMPSRLMGVVTLDSSD